MENEPGGGSYGEDDNADRPQSYEDCYSLASGLHLIKTIKNIVKYVRKYDNVDSEVVSRSWQAEAGFLASLKWDRIAY